jgi:hypothetical protein
MRTSEWLPPLHCPQTLFGSRLTCHSRIPQRAPQLAPVPSVAIREFCWCIFNCSKSKLMNIALFDSRADFIKKKLHVFINNLILILNHYAEF